MTWGKLFYDKYLFIEFVQILGKLRDFIGNLITPLIEMIHRINKLSQCYLVLAIIDLGMLA